MNYKIDVGVPYEYSLKSNLDNFEWVHLGSVTEEESGVLHEKQLNYESIS